MVTTLTSTDLDNDHCPRCGESMGIKPIALRAALENSTSMMEAMMVQMYSWEIEPTVNVRGQMSLNKKLLTHIKSENWK